MTSEKRGFVRPVTLVDRQREAAVKKKRDAYEKEVGLFMGMTMQQFYRSPFRISPLCHGRIVGPDD